MFKKTICFILIIAHFLTFGFVKDTFAFTAQSQSYNLSSGTVTQGGAVRTTASFKISQDAIGEPCVGGTQSTNYKLTAGFIPTLKSMPPVMTQAIPTQTWNENESKTNFFNLDNYFSSPDHLALTYTVSGNSSISIVIDPATHTVSFSQPQGWSGTEHIRFMATDTESNSTMSNDVSLQVIQFNHPPVLDFIPDISANENDLVAIVPHATDLEGDAITYSFTAPLNAQGRWQTGYSDAGLYTVTITATDATGLKATQAVRINVRNLNRPPVLDSFTNITVNEGDLVTLTPHATDPDNDAITYYYSAPLDSTGKWLTGYNDAGTYTATVTASDGMDTVSKPVQIIINNVNRPPQATLTLDKYTVNPNQTLTVNLFGTDPDNDLMTFSLKKDGVEIASGSFNGTYSTTLSFPSTGDHTIAATILDSKGLSLTVSKGVDVVDPNTNPNLINPVMGDFNGDALTDLGVYNSANGTWEICLSDGGVFRNAVDWITNFGASGNWLPIGGDFNGDGKTDAAIYNYSNGQLQVALSTGSSFSSPGTWLTATFANSSWQPFTGNFNGDKFTDFGLYNKDTGEVKVALGTGSGFGAFTTWVSNFGTGYIAVTGDFNGDSLTDICLFNKTTGEFKVAFSNTKAFVDGTTWISGFAVGKDAIISDFNNDGLADIGYWDQATANWYYSISTGAKFVDKGVWANFGTVQDETVSTGDFNGDGLMDLATFDRDQIGITRWKTQLSTNKPADLLTQIDNSVGGKTNVVYGYASQYDNSQLPFPVYVASSISLIDTLPSDQPEEIYTQNFSYSGGYFDFQEREFRGFAVAKVTDPITNNYTETYFYQGKPDQDGALKGQIDKILSYDGDNRQISQTLNTYEVRKAGPQDNVLGFPILKETATTVWEEDGSSLATAASFTYDNIGNVVEAVNEGDVSVAGDEKSTATTYAQAYQVGFNRPLETVLKDKDGNVVSKKDFEYDSKGNLTKDIVDIYNPITQLHNNAITQYSYDSFGNLTLTTNALGQTVATEYETTFSAYPQKITNILGHSVRYVYDSKLGVVTSVTDPNGNTSTTTYDSLGRPLQAKNAYGDVVTTYSYPDFNTKITTQLNLTKTEYADGLGRKYKVVSCGEDGAAARAVSSEVYYNDRGLVEKESVAHYIDEDPSQISYVCYEYDLRGRPVKTISDFPGTSKDSESQINYVNPLYVETTDPQGHKKGTLKDIYGNITEVTEFTTGGVYKTEYEYDIQNNLIRLTDSKGNISQIWYDSLGRKLKMNDPDMGIWTYEYDLLGNLTKQTDAKNQVLEFSYDALNRLTGKKANGQNLVTYVYDDPVKENCIGRLSKITDQSGSTEFFYDKLGREVKSVKTVDGTSYVVERTYDILDRLLTLKYPDGEIVNYTYDANSGLLEKVAGASTYVQNINYNAKGQLLNIRYGNNTQTDYTYGQDLRLSRILTQGAATLQDLNYVFDKNGNITTLTDNLRNNVRNYIYDDLDRLAQAQNVPAVGGGYTTFNYQYDSIGNMIYKSDVGVMTYGAGAGPHALTSAGGYSYQYDANGNMVSGKNKTCGYDVENRIINVTQAGVVTNFVYDGDGGRVKKTTPQGTTTYIGSLFEKDSSGKTTKHIFAGSQKVCEIKSVDSGPSTVDYYHSDHLGSSSIITDQNGQQVAHYEYTPYGSLAQTEGSDVVKHKFTGKELDDSTGLYFYGARYYDPEIGRFVTADTIVQSPYDPQSLNRYSYCRNNPLNYVDPSGHSWFSKFWGTIVGVVAGIVGTILTGGNMMAGYQIFNFFQSLQSTINTGNWGAFAGGLAGGLIGGYVGGALAGQVAGALGKSTFTFGGGFLIGATEMGVAGFGGSFGGALGGGASFGDAMQSGAMGLGIGAVTGGFIEGSYLSGMQNFAHGINRDSVGKAAGVDRRITLEVVRKPLPKLAKDFVGGEGGDHWGLRIRDNYNEFNGTWDFDIAQHDLLTKTGVVMGARVGGRAGFSRIAYWTDTNLVSADTAYVTKVYANIQDNIGKHFYKLDTYNCQTWVNNRRYLLNDNFN